MSRRIPNVSKTASPLATDVAESLSRLGFAARVACSVARIAKTKSSAKTPPERHHSPRSWECGVPHNKRNAHPFCRASHWRCCCASNMKKGIPDRIIVNPTDNRTDRTSYRLIESARAKNRRVVGSRGIPKRETGEAARVQYVYVATSPEYEKGKGPECPKRSSGQFARRIRIGTHRDAGWICSSGR